MKRTDQERLQLFCEVVDRALARRAFRDGTISAGFSMRGEQDKPFEYNVDLGDDDDLRSALLDVRKFLSPKEDVFFPASPTSSGHSSTTKNYWKRTPRTVMRGAACLAVAEPSTSSSTARSTTQRGCSDS